MPKEYAETKDYMIVRAVDKTRLTREVIEGKVLKFKRGLSPATINRGTDQNRSYEAALKHRLYLAETGQIQIAHPQFGDDTKPSFDRAVIDGSELQISVGLTSFQAFGADLERRKSDPEMNKLLQSRGERDFNDIGAYLQQAVGALGLVMTSDGSIVIGQRRTTAHEYDGFLDSATGYVTFPKPSDDNKNPIETPELLNPAQDAKRLVEREFGIEQRLMKEPILLGFHGHPDIREFDIAYLVHVDVDSKYFATENYPKTAKRKPEDIILVAGYDEVHQVFCWNTMRGRAWTSTLVEKIKDKKFTYSTWGALLSLKETDFR